MGIEFYVGGHAGTLPGREPGQRDRDDLAGLRMFSAAHPPNIATFDLTVLKGILDSGAFTDVGANIRLSYEQALTRQLEFELAASLKWGAIEQLGQAWQAYALVSYDELIDEIPKADAKGGKVKERWRWHEAGRAMQRTVEAAAYLASQRERLAPRRLVLSMQGVDAIQYRECAEQVLEFARPEDIIGLGGWCILGRQTSLLPVFGDTLYQVLPMIKQAGIKDVHIFGVMYLPALGGLLWLADQYGLQISTDSTGPVMACTYKDKKKAGVRVASGYWRDNVAWWMATLANLRETDFYRQPFQGGSARQGLLDFELEEVS